MSENGPTRRVLRSTEPNISTRKALGGTIYGTRGRISSHLQAIAEMFHWEDPAERERAEIAGLIPQAPGDTRLKLRRDLVPTVDVTEAQWHLWEDNLRGIDLFAGRKLEPDTSWQQSHDKQRPYVGAKGFSQVPNWYVDHVLPLVGKRHPSAWLVLSYVLRLAGVDGTFKVNQRLIAARTGLSRRTVQYALDLLAQATIVTIVAERRGRRVTRYQLTPVGKVDPDLMVKAFSLRRQ
jgi:hypothetical protein